MQTGSAYEAAERAFENREENRYQNMLNERDAPEVEMDFDIPNDCGYFEA